MNKKAILITGSVIAVLALGVFIGQKVSVPKAEAEKAYPESAQVWIQNIKEGSASWKKQDEILTRLKAERLSAEQLKLDEENTIRGIRAALCTKYHLIVTETGEVKESTGDCSSF